jgi:hypothetical protein
VTTPVRTANDRASLDDDFAQFAALLGKASELLDRGRHDSAAAYAQIAAQFAWLNPSGIFVSAELEALLTELAQEIPEESATRAGTADPAIVLHVVTQAYRTGGSTQAVSCWIDQDLGRHHRVCLTRQLRAEVPDKISRALSTPDDLVRLDLLPGGLMRRAARLRAEAAHADVVLLHCHPYDVVPVLAFAGTTSLPPVVNVNHADHVFWVGVGITNVLLNMRISGQELAIARRGVDPRRCVVMARPLRLAQRALPREEAKRALGLPEDAILVITAADKTKYQPVSGPSLLEMILPVFEQHRSAFLLAAGPAAEGEWANAEARTNGRIRALGVLSDVTALHLAADVYLDSFPFSSLTSLLEAGNLGSPSITYRGHPDDCLVLGADTPGVDELMRCPADPEALRAELARMITDARWRVDLGERTRRMIIGTHTGQNWRRGIADVYRTAHRVRSTPTVGPVQAGTSELDTLVQRVMRQTGYAEGVCGVLRDGLALLPVRERLAAGRQLYRAGTRVPGRRLIPEWWLAQVNRSRELVARARSWLRRN